MVFETEDVSKVCLERAERIDEVEGRLDEWQFGPPEI